MDTLQLKSDFLHVASLAGVNIESRHIRVEEHLAPHRPPTSLPPGMMAVYVFHLGEDCLKVGKVGPKSQARYTSQHYAPASSQSNLAKSLLVHRDELGLIELNPTTVGAWMKANLDRSNFLVDSSLGVPVLTLLESFLQCRLRPRFEGFASQR